MKILQRFVHGSCDYLILLYLCQLDEVYGISGYTDGKLRIFLRVCLCVQKGLSV